MSLIKIRYILLIIYDAVDKKNHPITILLNKIAKINNKNVRFIDLNG